MALPTRQPRVLVARPPTQYKHPARVRTENGARFREHLWMPYGKRFRRLEMERGCQVRLRGKVNRYWYKPKARWQYEVTNVNQFEVIDDE